MSRKYLLIGPARGIGGWQLYIDARCNHLLKMNVDVFLLYDGRVGGEVIKLCNISRVAKLDVQMEEPYWYSRKRINKEILRIKEFINFQSEDEIFIESTSIIYSFWGELIAKEVNGQNFSYLLHSHTLGMPLAWKKFFSFKYDQDLIAGQSDNTLPELFDGYRSIDKTDTRRICAAFDAPLVESRVDCQAVIEDLQTFKNESRKLIGYFGVLRKPHFVLLCDAITSYVKKHIDTNFCFVIIGSSGRKTEEIYNEESKIEEMRKLHIGNMEVYHIPEMYPIPRKMFECLDVCVGSFGSATTAAMACNRVIRLPSDKTLDVQGVIGITVEEEKYWLQPIRNERIEDIFDEILFGSNYSNYEYSGELPWLQEKEGHKEVDRLMRPFDKRKKGYTYFDVYKLPFLGGISFVKFVIFRCLGIERGRLLARKIKSFVGCRRVK